MIEFLSSARAGNRQVTVQIDDDEAARWGTEGYFLVSGGAAGVGKKIDGVVYLLHRQIMGATDDQEVRFRDGNKFNVQKSNLYLVPKRTKLVSMKHRDSNSDAPGDTESDEGSDMQSDTLALHESVATAVQVKPRKNAARAKAAKAPRKPKSIRVAPVVIEQQETPMHVAPQMTQTMQVEFLPVANHAIPANNIITTIDHLPETGQNIIDVVTSVQFFDQNTMRTDWFTVSVTDDEANVLRTYLKLRVNGEILNTAQALKDANATIAKQRREIADYDKQIAKLQDENARLHLRVKEAARKEKKLENVAAMFLSEQAA